MRGKCAFDSFHSAVRSTCRARTPIAPSACVSDQARTTTLLQGIMDGVGHFLILEKPAQFNAALTDVLRKLDLIEK